MEKLFVKTRHKDYRDSRLWRRVLILLFFYEPCLHNKAPSSVFKCIFRREKEVPIPATFSQLIGCGLHTCPEGLSWCCSVKDSLVVVTWFLSSTRAVKLEICSVVKYLQSIWILQSKGPRIGCGEVRLSVCPQKVCLKI